MTTQVNKESKIAVLCGGWSSEREVSLRSGKNCLDALRRLGYRQSFLVDMDRNVALRLREEGVELVFLALHGTFGEDGCIQGLLEIMDIPYTGNRVLSSAVTFNKSVTKQILKESGLPVLPSLVVHRHQAYSEIEHALKAAGMSYPLMLKPIADGSSVGMSKLNSAEDLHSGLNTVFNCSETAMFEPFLEGKSLTIGILDKPQEPIVTPILELRTALGWYDYESKYTPGMTEFILPAELDKPTTLRLQELSLKAHQACLCYGVSRVDWIVTPSGDAYILEINTIPGMTDLSDLPAQAQAMGIGYDELVEIILHTALQQPSGKTPSHV